MRIKIAFCLLLAATVCFFCGCTEGVFNSQEACTFQGIEEVSLLASDYKFLLIKFAVPERRVIPIYYPKKESLESLKEIKEGERVLVRYVRQKNGFFGEAYDSYLEIIALDSGKRYSFSVRDVR